MRTKRIAAGIVAAAVLTGSVGVAVVYRGDTAVVNDNDIEQTVATEYSYEYGVVQSLWFKINELWRLSINSDLDMEVITAISALNSGFDSELLMKAVKAEGDEVIDEYIYSVLAGLDFELYLSDKEEYEKAKSEAEYTGEVLTVERINEYLNQLNEQTANKQVDEALNSVPVIDVPNNSTVTPEVPTAESILPENPAEAVRRETEAITNRALGIEVE